MPTIPTPFIGGTEGPEHDRSDQNDLEPPFFAEEPAESRKEPEPGAGAAEAADPEAEPPFFFEPEPEDPVTSPETAPDQQPVPIEQVTPSEPGPDVLTPSAEPEPADQPAGDDEDLPDFLFGPDTPPPFSSPKGTAATAPLPESPELLATQAEELLEGAHGDRIRDLVASLGAATAEVAIPRAFAAGYMAAKRGEES